jgi:hypothetical protein
MPLPTCAPFCPLFPLQDYLLQGWYSSFSLYFLLGFLPHHHCSFATPCFCSRKKWWTLYILPIKSSPSPSSSPSLSADKFTLSLPLLHPLSNEYPPQRPQVSSSSCSSPIFQLHELSSCHVPITVLNVFFKLSPIFMSDPIVITISPTYCKALSYPSYYHKPASILFPLYEKFHTL